MKNNISLAVFDLAGTTVKDDNGVRNCLYEAARDFNIKVTPEEIADLMGTNKIHLYQYLIEKNKGSTRNFRKFEKNIDASTRNEAEKIYDVYVKYMIDYYKNNCEEIEGTSETFEWCQKNNIKVATGTGFHSDINEAIFDKLNWLKDGLVDFAVDLDMVPDGKGRPAPFMIFKAMEYLNIQDVKQVIKLGDTPADMLEGYNAGCRAVIGVLGGSTPIYSWGKYWHTHVIETVKELPELIESGMIV